MRYLFYHYNDRNGALILDYIDENGNRSNYCFMYYSLRKAIRVFRWRNNLSYKHITVQQLQ